MRVVTAKVRPLPRDGEPSHAAIIHHIEILRAETGARFDAIDKEAEYIRGRVDGLAADVAVLKANPTAPGTAREHDGGFPFKHGWRSWTVIGVAVVTGLAALKAALLAMDAIWAGVQTAWHTLTH